MRAILSIQEVTRGLTGGIRKDTHPLTIGVAVGAGDTRMLQFSRRRQEIKSGGVESVAAAAAAVATARRRHVAGMLPCRRVAKSSPVEASRRDDRDNENVSLAFAPCNDDTDTKR